MAGLELPKSHRVRPQNLPIQPVAVMGERKVSFIAGENEMKSEGYVWSGIRCGRAELPSLWDGQEGGLLNRKRARWFPGSLG